MSKKRKFQSYKIMIFLLLALKCNSCGLIGNFWHRDLRGVGRAKDNSGVPLLRWRRGRAFPKRQRHQFDDADVDNDDDDNDDQDAGELPRHRVDKPVPASDRWRGEAKEKSEKERSQEDQGAAEHRRWRRLDNFSRSSYFLIPNISKYQGAR